MVRTIIHGARIGGGRCPNGVQHIPVSNFHLIGGGGGGGGRQSGQGLLVLPPRCDIFLVRTLASYTFLLRYVGMCRACRGHVKDFSQGRGQSRLRQMCTLETLIFGALWWRPPLDSKNCLKLFARNGTESCTKNKML